MQTIVDMELSRGRIETLRRLLQEIPQDANLRRILAGWEEVVNGSYSFLVMDLDGSLRDLEVRKGPLDMSVVSELCRLGNQDGIELCIATGRRSSGKPVADQLTQEGLKELKMILMSPHLVK